LRALLKTLIFPFFFLVLLLTFAIIPSHSQYLGLTVETNRTKYYVGEVVQIYGNLTLDGTLVTDGLVAIEVNDVRNTPIVIRTLDTGTVPQLAWYVYVSTVFASDQYGNPRDSFWRGQLAYFNVTVVNNDIEPRQTLTTVSAFDQNQVPLATGSIKTTLSGQTYTRFIMGIPIPTDAALGTATAFANAYSDWPMLQGVPYCPEKNADFTIVGSGAAATSTIQQTEINYNLTFKLPVQVPKGNFTAYLSSTYQGLAVYNSIIFQVKIVGDINGDNRVDYRDVYLLLASYGKSYPDYNPEADFNRDGIVNYLDVYLFLKNWGKVA